MGLGVVVNHNGNSVHCRKNHVKREHGNGNVGHEGVREGIGKDVVVEDARSQNQKEIDDHQD
jgi:hypothetical protein